MTEQEESAEAFANLQQLYGDLYQHSDFKRGERIQYTAYDGSTRTGEIIWVQKPSTATGRTGKEYHLRAQYIVAPDQDTGMPDFVPLGSVQGKVE